MKYRIVQIDSKPEEHYIMEYLKLTLGRQIFYNWYSCKDEYGHTIEFKTVEEAESHYDKLVKNKQGKRTIIREL